VLDIDDKARLIVRLEDGSEKTISTGEVSIKFE
jgi:biotin-(acetyl-CoA carboxylase) ligase